MNNLDFYRIYFSRIELPHLKAEMNLARIQEKPLIQEMALKELARRKQGGKRAHGCGLPGKLWSPDELEVLSQYAKNGAMTIDEVLNLLPGRTEMAIRAKMSKIGLSRVETLVKELEERL